MTTRTGVLIFEGGQRHPLLAEVRRWTTLDTAEKFLRRPETDVLVVATDSDALARQAGAVGAEVHRTGPVFHFGRTLGGLVHDYGLDRVVYLGGGSVPLLRPEELDWLFARLGPGGRVFVANNVQSPDLVALGSTGAVEALAPLATDNATLFTLADAGYERLLLPDTPTTSFDLDTPSDILFLAHEARRARTVAGAPGQPGFGPRCAKGLAGLELDLSVLERAAEVLSRDYASVTLIGRVSGVTMNHLNSALRLRLRVFSEERGMKALGRVDRGEVRSLLGWVMEDLGVEYLVRRLAELSDAVFWDTRVVMAHLGDWPTEADRFEADLGRWQGIENPALRSLCRAAGEARVPVVLGGHSVVSGGLRLLADSLQPRRR